MIRKSPSRAEILRAVVALAQQRRDGRLTPRLPDGTAVVPGAFADELDLVGALLLRWHARLSGHLERELARHPLDRRAAVVRAWSRAAEESAGLRLIVDQYLAHPVDARMAQALRRAQAKERAHLAVAAGLAGGEGPAAVEAGARLESAARAAAPALPTPQPMQAAAPGTPDQGSLVARIKAVLAA
ncbi:MAG TPA: hypothetical protein VFM09_09280 [Marmoricola sp.]|nr:hypothetical protein [Marmoricola sp.]